MGRLGSSLHTWIPCLHCAILELRKIPGKRGAYIVSALERLQESVSLARVQ